MVRITFKTDRSTQLSCNAITDIVFTDGYADFHTENSIEHIPINNIVKIGPTFIPYK